MLIASDTRRAPAGGPTWPLKTILAVLFLGPLIAPVFQATALPLVADSGALARQLLSHYVCPTPAKSYMLLGFPMAVCARCWGATIGLWLAWLAVSWHAQGRVSMPLIFNLLRAPWPLRLLLAALPFLLWVLEIRFWPVAPLPLLLVNGTQAGCAAGLFFCSIWPGLLEGNPRMW